MLQDENVQNIQQCTFHLDSVETKRCNKCLLIKPLFDFSKDNTSKDKHQRQCKQCHSVYLRQLTKEGTHKHQRCIISRCKELTTQARKRNLKKRNREFNISYTDILDVWDKQKGLCAYTGLPMVATSHQLNTVSLDRVDSKTGYVIGNIQLVCAIVNKMKLDMEEKEFFLMSHLIAQNNKLSETPDKLLAQYIPVGISDYIAPNNYSLCSDV